MNIVEWFEQLLLFGLHVPLSTIPNCVHYVEHQYFEVQTYPLLFQVHTCRFGYAQIQILYSHKKTITNLK